MIWEIDDGPRPIEGLDEHGLPDPGYAASLGLIPAPVGARVGAAVVEWALALLLAVPALWVVVPLVVDALAEGFDPAALLARGDLVWLIVAVAVSNALITVYTLVQLILHGRRGVTLGKAVFGIRSVNVRTLERPRFWRGAVVRYLVASASLIVPLVGPLLVVALSPFFDVDRRRRGWLDQAAGTWFVDARRGLNPYDAKRMRIARKRVKTAEHAPRAALPSLATPVNRDAPSSYRPGARLSGGVIGAHRESAPSAGASAPIPAAPAAAAGAAPPVAAAGEALVSSAPAVLSAAVALPARPAPAAAPEPPSVLSGPALSGPALSGPALPGPVLPGPAGGAASSEVRAVLELDSGERIDVRAVTLLGRAPAAAAGEGTVQLVPIDDDTRSVSKTHLAIVPARRGVFAVDRTSTNGSAVVRDGQERVLVPGEPVEVRPGDTVRFGDRSLRVMSA